MLKEIMKKCSGLDIDEQRSITDEYAELVFLNKEIDAWRKVLSDILGPEAKPVGAEPSESELDLTKDYGGIHSNQTLFKKAVEEGSIIAMLWPWQDGLHTTLKMAVVRNG